MFNRIVLATDGTASGDAAVSFTLALVRESGASVRVVHVNERLVGGRGVASETELEAMDIVDRAVARLRWAGANADGVHHLANCFRVCEVIAEAAHSWGADVIVFGSRRHRRFPRLAGRGIRERVTALTGLPALTSPPPLRVAQDLRREQLPEPLLAGR